MDLTAALFAVGCILAFVASFFTPYDRKGAWETSVISTGGLIIYWGVNNTIYMVFPLWTYVVSDILFSVAYAYLFKISRWHFSGMLVPLMASNVFFDVLYHTGNMSYPDMMSIENWILAVMLVVSASLGIWVVIKGIVRASIWLFRAQMLLMLWPFIALYRVGKRVLIPALESSAPTIDSKSSTFIYSGG